MHLWLGIMLHLNSLNVKSFVSCHSTLGLMEWIAIAFFEASSAAGCNEDFRVCLEASLRGRFHHVQGRGGRKGAIDGPHHNSQYSFMSGINAWQIKIQEGRRRRRSAVTSLINANRIRFSGFSCIVCVSCVGWWVGGCSRMKECDVLSFRMSIVGNWTRANASLGKQMAMACNRWPWPTSRVQSLCPLRHR